MIDYYPLIARAVTHLEVNSGPARRAIYERARAALAAQTVDFASFDVTNHQLALECAIRKVEAEGLRRALANLGSPGTVLRAEPDHSIRGLQGLPSTTGPLEEKRANSRVEIGRRSDTFRDERG
jgi:hypothetical protein